MKVLVCSPPAFIGDHNRHFIQAGSRWSFSIFVRRGFQDHYMPYPFAIGYSTALLKTDDDYDVRGLDACAEDYDDRQFVEECISQDSDLLVMDAPTISFPLVMPLLEEIKQRSDCKMMLTGGHVSALADEVMREHSFVDYCALGEYETLVKLVADAEAGKGDTRIKEIHGLAFRNNGAIVANEPVPQLYNLDDIPYPDREDFPVELYHDFEIAGKPCVHMLTSLGCPYKCTFCMPIRVMHGDSATYRKRSPDKIVDEMEYVRNNHKAKQVYFDDDTFAVDKKRIRELCDRIRTREPGIPWTAMGDVTLDRGTLESLANADCVGIKFGIETASSQTLGEIKKYFLTIEKVKKFVAFCRDLGIWAHATFIIGLPGDRAEDIERTVELSSSLDLDSVQFSIATPFPGTPFYEQAKENGWLVTDDWTKYDGANYGVISYPWLSNGEIEHLHRIALQRWYARALVKELVKPRRLGYILKAGSFRYSLRKVFSHLQGTL